MKKFFAVFRFEFNKHFKSKPFIILTLLAVIGIAGFLSFPTISDMIRPDSSERETPSDGELSLFGIVNNSIYDTDTIESVLGSSITGHEIHILDIDYDTCQQMVADGEYQNILAINSESEYTLYTEKQALYSDVEYTVEAILEYQYMQYLLGEQGLDQSTAQRVLDASVDGDIVVMGKSEQDTFFYTYGIIMLLYMCIIIYGQLVATSVASEKSSRAMETLITTVKPTTMMFGKVIGSGCVALCQFGSILATAVIFYNINSPYTGELAFIGSVFNIPMQTLAVSLVLFILGFFVYAFLYAAIGSLVSRVEDISNNTLLITFSSVIGFMIVITSMSSGNVDSTLMQVCSYFPLTSPYALIAITSMSSPSAGQIILSITILVVTCIVVGYISALIYRAGVLLYGNPPKLKDIGKIIKSSIRKI